MEFLNIEAFLNVDGFSRNTDSSPEFNNPVIEFCNDSSGRAGSRISPTNSFPTVDYNGRNSKMASNPDPSSTARQLYVNSQSLVQQKVSEVNCSPVENNGIQGQESEAQRPNCPELTHLELPNDLPLDCRERLIFATSLCLSLLSKKGLEEVASKVMDKMPEIVRNRLADWAIEIEEKFFFVVAAVHSLPNSVEEGMAHHKCQESVGAGASAAKVNEECAHGVTSAAEVGSEPACEEVSSNPEKNRQVGQPGALWPQHFQEQAHGNYLPTISFPILQDNAEGARDIPRVIPGVPCHETPLVNISTHPLQQNTQGTGSDEYSNVQSLFPEDAIMRGGVLEGMAEWGQPNAYALGTPASQFNLNGKRSCDTLPLVNEPAAKRAKPKAKPSKNSNGLSAARIISRKLESLRRERVQVQEDINLRRQALNDPQVPGPSSGSSRFCHLCTRSGTPEILLKCNNLDIGTCRKVICHRCIREQGWDLERWKEDKTWVCTHCNKTCPNKAQCYTYKRVNQKRRTDGNGKRKVCSNPQ